MYGCIYVFLIYSHRPRVSVCKFSVCWGAFALNTRPSSN